MASNELDLQKLIVDAVREHGGFAMKMSHKFLAGIPDLLIQMQGHRAGLWEVKLKKGGNWQANIYGSVVCNLSPLQEKSLKNFDSAGGVAGVISFFKGPTEMMMAVAALTDLDRGGKSMEKIVISKQVYVKLMRGVRSQIIFKELERAHTYREEFLQHD